MAPTWRQLRAGPISSILLILLICLVPKLAQGAQLAIIIDDLGYNAVAGRRAINLPGHFTLAILPFTPFSRELAHQAHLRGKELMLHAPMSHSHSASLPQGTLTGAMDQHTFTQTLENMLIAIPNIVGVNNHMGSQLTSEKEPMAWLMNELVKRDLYFVDSRTTAQTLALQSAQQHGIPSMKRDIFLDNHRNTAAISQQLHKAIVLAKAQGKAIAIGHPYPETLSVLERIQPLLDEYEVELVWVSTLMKLEKKIQYCPAPPLLLWRNLQHNAAPTTTDFLQDITLRF